MSINKLILQISLIFLFSFFLNCSTETSSPTSPTVDHIAPAVEWVYPQAGAELSGVVELRFTVTDAGSGNIPVAGSNIDSIKVYLDGYSPDGWQIYDISSELQVLNWNTLNSDDGVHILEVRAWDSSGNLGISPSLRVIVKNGVPAEEDRTPPDVWWIAPEAGATLQGEVLLQVGFFDESGVDSVRLLKDGAVVVTLIPDAPPLIPPRKPGGSEDLKVRVNDTPKPQISNKPARLSPPCSAGGTQGGVEYLWNTLNDSDGVHVWEAQAWDGSTGVPAGHGNMGTSPALLVRVKNHDTPPEDRTPPVISWRYPESGTTVEGAVELGFDALDDDMVDSLSLYINGTTPRIIGIDGHNEALYTYRWETTSHEDGEYVLEVRARDCSGNIGFSDPLSLTVWNNRPRVFWVPDDYEKIQDAINASQDGDTVRVRTGTYYEGLRFMGKNIWLESEEGPELTFIDGTGWNDGVRLLDEENKAVIRGFTISAELNAIQSSNNSMAVIYNCIFRKDWTINGVSMITGNAFIYNCIFDSVDYGVYESYVRGMVENSIFANCRIGIAKIASLNNWIDHKYNIFYNNDENWSSSYQPDGSEIIANPLFRLNSYRLQEDSPAINAGNPEISDLDGTRSDIGVYGGPYMY